MMKGEATGKGLDIKGKSAKCGKQSGIIPFLQIHAGNDDKKLASQPPSGGRIRVFYKSVDLRAKALFALNTTLKEMEESYLNSELGLRKEAITNSLSKISVFTNSTTVEWVLT